MSDAPNSSIKPKLFCSVTLCRNFNNPYSSIDLYHLPNDHIQRKKFSEILGIPPSVAQSDTARVCALHFKSKMKNQPTPPAVGPDSKGKSAQITTAIPARSKIITVFRSKSTSGLITSTPNVMNTLVKKLAFPEKPAIETISLEENASDLASIADDPVEQRTDMTLELQCEEEQLSFAQLNSYFAQSAAYNKTQKTLPSSTPTVQTSTVSTQTNPVIIFDCDQISKSQPPKNISPEESSVLNSAIQSIKITPQVENCSIPLEEPSVLNSSPMELFTSVTDNASLISPKPIAVDRSNILPNQPVLVPQSINSENNSSASMPLLSLVSMAGGTYFTTTISPTTTPSTTISTAFALGDRSKIFTYVNTNSILRPSDNFSNPTLAFIPPVRQVLPSASNNRVQGVGSTIIQPTYFQNTSQNLLGTSMPVSSASSTLLSFASNYTTQLVKTPCGGLTLTASNPQEPISCIPLQNQIRFEARPPPPYQLPQQQPFQLISLNENPGGLSPFSQPLDQQIMNEGQLLGPISNSSFNSDPYSSISFNSDPYSSSHFNSQEFQNYPARDFSETPYQVLVQKNDNTKFLLSNSLPGATQPVFNSSESLIPGPITIESDPEDKEDELLAMCNVATIYGSESSTPSDGIATPDSRSVGEDQGNPKTGPTLKTNSAEDTLKDTIQDIGSSDNESTESDCSQHSMGPLIVDVISATEGAKDYYVGDKIPNIFYGKKKKNKSKKLKKKAITNKIDATKKTQTHSVLENTKESVYKSKSDAVPWRSTSSGTVAEKTYSKDNQDGSSVHLLFKRQNGPVQAVKLHNSVFSLQTSIPIIPNGQQQCLDPLTLLELKIPIGRIGIDDAMTLRKKLTSEKFISCSVMWLIRRNYLPLASPCICGSHTFNITRNEKFTDGYCWKCADLECGLETQMKRPKLFESFKTYTLQELLLLTYHWACQSSLKEILMDVNLNCAQIFDYYKALRDICHKTLCKKCKLGLSANVMVETALVKLGNFFVIGAYDRKTRYSRLEAITQLEAYSTTVHIELLGNWLGRKAKLVSDKKIADNLLPEITTVSAINNVTDASSNLPHILNISKYLIDNLTAVFGKVNQNNLPLKVVQGFLYELQWRGKYAKFFDMSFWSIMNHIRDFNDPNEARTIALPGEFNVASQKVSNESSKRWGVPLPEQKSTKLSEKLARIQQKIVDQPSKPNTTQGNSVTNLKKNIQPKIRTASELFQDVPEIPGGSSNITSNALLAIKIRCEFVSPPGVYKPNATSLGLQLRTEGFISDPVKWLVKRGYVNCKSSCYVCKGPSILRENAKYKDGCSWMCQNTECKFQNMFKRPQFFARFNEQTMAHVAAMIFHWTVQSDYNIITSDVPMDSVKICHAWRAFQVVCSSALKRQNYKIGGEGQIVEIALVQFGKLYILGARERLTKRTLLKCFPVSLPDQVNVLYHTIRSWISEKTYVVANSTALFSMSNWTMYRVFPADTTITEKTSTRMHVLNITSYLLKHIFEMFGHLKADLVEYELMQIYLDELMWRERFGKLPNLAFAKIMYEIFYHEKNKSQLLFENHKVKELLQEDIHSLNCRKEVRVILHRVPETVLKYYKCLPSDYATSRKLASSITDVSESEDESSDSSEDLMEAVSAALEGESLSDVSSSETHDTPIDDEKPRSSLQAKNKIKDLEVLNRSRHTPSVRTYSRAFEASKQSPNKTKLVNSVQPLVLKMNKNCKNYQSYLKSEFLKAKYKKQRSRSKFNSRKLSRKKKCVKKKILDAPQASVENAFTEIKIKIEPGTSGICQTLSPANDYSSGVKLAKRASSILRRLGTTGEPICVECGRVVSLDHFMKQFHCTDCKNVVYTTCCSNAFFEHRSALLFGKRMPRRDKVAHGHGLHHFRILTHTAVCPCGFKSKVGNQIASHLVKCQETTCFYNEL